jgi:hypothetical protein
MYDDDDDDDGNDDFFGDNTELTFEQTMFKMSALAEIFRMSGKIEFFLDKNTEDGTGIPSFKFYPDTTFGFVFD